MIDLREDLWVCTVVRHLATVEMLVERMAEMVLRCKFLINVNWFLMFDGAWHHEAHLPPMCLPCHTVIGLSDHRVAAHQSLIQNAMLDELQDGLVSDHKRAWIYFADDHVPIWLGARIHGRALAQARFGALRFAGEKELEGKRVAYLLDAIADQRFVVVPSYEEQFLAEFSRHHVVGTEYGAD